MNPPPLGVCHRAGSVQWLPDPSCETFRSWERAGNQELHGGTMLPLRKSVPQLGLGSPKTCLPKAGILMWSGEIAVTVRGRETPLISSGKDK